MTHCEYVCDALERIETSRPRSVGKRTSIEVLANRHRIHQRVAEDSLGQLTYTIGRLSREGQLAR